MSYDSLTTIKRLERYQLVVVVRTDTPEDAYMAAEACIKAGVRLIEITFSVPDASRVIEKLKVHKGVTLGAGTVLSIKEAKKAIKAGASYIVSPHLDEEIIKFTKKEGAVSIPGASTPTEIYRGYKAGGDIIKLFPFVEIGGLNFLKTIRGPLPFLKYMLSGGVTLSNISDYLKANVSGVIIGSSIIKSEFVRAKDWKSITETSRIFVKKTETVMKQLRSKDVY